MQAANTQRADLVEVLFNATCLAPNSEQSFIYASGQSPVKSFQRSQTYINYLAALYSRLAEDHVAQSQLFIKMINQGNFVEIECELNRQAQSGLLRDARYGAWQRLAECIAELHTNTLFHFKRLYISQLPFRERDQSLQEAVDEAKAVVLHTIGLPQVSTGDISWDALSYKVPPNGAYYLCQMHPDIVDELTQANVAVIDQLQDDLSRLIQTKISEQRAIITNERPGERENEYISDASAFYEELIAAEDDPLLPGKISNKGDQALINYVMFMQPIFAQGHIPGTIAPAKITCCQDIVSAVELRAAIQHLSSTQIVQKEELIDNPNVRAGMRLMSDKADDLRQRWSMQQSASMNQARAIDQSLSAGLSSFSEKALQPQRELDQQLSGGSNTLYDQLNMQRHDGVVNLNFEEKETLRQCISLLLACLRIRFDATQASKNELVTAQDIEHLEICKRLSQYCDPDTQRTVYQQVAILGEAIVNGHNMIKTKGYGLPEAVNQQIQAEAESHAKQIVETVPLLQKDMQQNGPLFAHLMQSYYLALANQSRLIAETTLRLERRTTVINAAGRFGQQQ